MKTAALAFAAAIAVAGAASAQDHAAPAGHPHGEGHADHAHDPAHYATAMHAEHTLRDTIASLQAGTPDFDSMIPELAQAVRDQSAAMTPALASLGELQTLALTGEPQPGVHQFLATFANGQTTWTISINAENKIDGLFVQ